MILAFANRLIKGGYNSAQKMWVEAIDIDRTSALMCYVQLSLWNIPTRVIVGNALSLEMKESFIAKSNKSIYEIIVPTKPDKKTPLVVNYLCFDG